MLSADRLKAFASIDNSRDISASWENDFDGELMTMTNLQSVQEEDPQEKTIRPNWRVPAKPERVVESKPQPSKSSPRKRSGTGHQKQKSQQKNQLGSRFELPMRPDLAYREQSVEDYSDLFDGNDNVFNYGLGLSKKVRTVTSVFAAPRLGIASNHLHAGEQPDAPQLFHPSDLTSLPRSMQSPVAGSMKRQPSARPSVLPDRPLQRSKSSIEIQKFAEDEGDEDFSDIFGPGDNLTEKEDSDQGSEDGNMMVLSRLSNNSWLGDDEDEDDPFASMDPDWNEMDLEANIARDRHGRLAANVEELIRSLKTTEGEDRLLELSEDLVSFHEFLQYHIHHADSIFSKLYFAKILK